MEERDRKTLRKHWIFLRQNLEPFKVIPHLDNLLTEEDVDDVRSQKTRTSKVDKLLEIIILRGPKAFTSFVRAIEATPGQKFVAGPLLEDSGMIPQDVENMRNQLRGERQNTACLRRKVSELQEDNGKLKRQMEDLHRENSAIKENLRKCRVKMKYKDVLNVWGKYQLIKRKDFLESNCRELEEKKEELNEALEESKLQVEGLEKTLEDIRYDNEIKAAQIVDEMQKTPRELALCSMTSIDIESEVFGCSCLSSNRSTNNLELQDKQVQVFMSRLSPSPTPPTTRREERANDTQELKDQLKTLQEKMDSLKSNHALELNAKESQLKNLDDLYSQEKIKRLNHHKKIRDLEKRLRSLQNEFKKQVKNTENISSADDEGTIEKMRQQLKEMEKCLNKEKKKRRDVDDERKKYCLEAIDKKRQIDILSLKVERLVKQLDRLQAFPGRIFSYHTDFDTNGVIYGLATNFGTSPWTDPASSGKVSVVRSSNCEGQASQIILHTVNARKNPKCCTNSERNSWWQVGLTANNALILSHYTLRHGCNDGVCVLKNWEFQGSNDGAKWTTLDQHKDSTSLPLQSFSTCTFRVRGNITAMKYFRVVQTGKNSSGNYRLYLSGLELYGLLVQTQNQ